MTKKDKIIYSLLDFQSKVLEIQNRAELYLIQTALSKSDIFVETLLDVIESQTHSLQTKLSAVFFLKKTLDSSVQNSTGCIENLNDIVVHDFKRRSISISSIASCELKEKICELIAEVAGSLILSNDRMKNKSWNNICQTIIELHATQKVESITSALKITAYLANKNLLYILAYRHQIFKLFKESLSDIREDVKIEAISSFTLFLRALRPADLKTFKPLQIHLLEGIPFFFKLKNTQNLQKLIFYVHEICEKEPIFFKSEFCLMFKNIIEAIEICDIDTKIISIDCIVLQIEQFPVCIENDMKSYQSLIDIITNVITDSFLETSPSQSNLNKFGENDTNLIDSVTDLFERLIAATINDDITEILYCHILENFKKNEKISFSIGLYLFSCSGKYIHSEVEPKFEECLSFIINWIEKSDKNPDFYIFHYLGKLIRSFDESVKPNVYSCCLHVIKTAFTFDNKSSIFLKMIDLLSILIEKASNELIEKDFLIFQEIIFKCLKFDNNQVKENCLIILGLLAIKTPIQFQHICENVFKIVYSNINQTKLSKLKANALVLFGILAQNFNDDFLTQFIEIYLKEILNAQDEIINDMNLIDLHVQIAECISRLFVWTKPKIQAVFEQFFPTFLKIIVLNFCKIEKIEWSQSEKNNFETILKTLQTILSFSDDRILYFINELFDYFCRVSQSSKLDIHLLKIVLESIPLLFNSLRESAKDFSKLQKKMIFEIFSFGHLTDEPEIAIEFCISTLKMLALSFKIFSDDDLILIFRTCVQILKNSEDRLAKVNDFFDVEEENKQEIEHKIDETFQVENVLFVKIAEVFGIIFKNYKERTLNIFAAIYKKYVFNFNRKSGFKTKHFVLAFIDQSVEEIGEFLSFEVKHKFLKICIDYCMDQEISARIFSSRSIGVLVTKFGDDLEEADFENCVKILTQTIDWQKENEWSEECSTSKENAVSAFGKLFDCYQTKLKNERASLYFHYWIKHLPIKSDLKQCAIQNEILSKNLLNNGIKLGVLNKDILLCVLRVILEMKKNPTSMLPQTKSKIDIILKTMWIEKATKNVIESIRINESDGKYLGFN